MSEIFLKIINMSISASYIVLAVLLLRLLLKKAPKWITVVLWGIVAVRLICPFSIESVLSLIPSSEVVSPNIMTDKTPTINTGIPIINSALNPVISESFTPNPGDSANPLQIWIPVLTAIWIVGMVALLIYTVISYARVRRKIGTAVLLRDNIYQSENVVSPFVLGIIKPKVYLPFNMNEKDMEHVVAHEMAHIRRKDHLWKPLGFLLLTLHWFNPLMWLGYVLLCRDIELACDEKVIKELDHDARADYSEALLTCSVNRRMIAACPLAFGEVGVKDRVKSVLNYKKPAFWIIIAAVVACVVVAVCFLTNPPAKEVNLEFPFEIEDVENIEMYHYVGTPGQVEKKVIESEQDIKTLYNKFESITYKLKKADDVAGVETTSFRFNLSDGTIYELIYCGYGVKNGILKSPTVGFEYFTSADIGWNWSWLNKGLEAVVVDKSELPGYNSNNGTYTEYEGVYITIDSITKDTGGQNIFNIVWHNETDKEITYGEMYTVEYKYGDEWIDTDFDEERYFTTIGYSLKKNKTVLKSYTSEHLDISKSGTYRFMVPFSVKEGDKYVSYKTWAEFKVGFIPTTEYLRERNPEYFGLDDSKGLDVYVWQMAKNSYSFGLLPHDEQGRDWLAHELLNLRGTSAEEMSVILSTYNIDENDIYIIPWQNPISSYLAEWQILGEGEDTDDLNAKRQAYIEHIRQMLSSVIVPMEFETVYDTATFDIDNDGFDEVCTMSIGPTSGLFTFTFNVRQIGTGEVEYHTVIYSQWYDLSFQKGSDGITRVQGITQGENPITRLFDISIKDGNVYLTENGVYIAEIN